jgi:hypothetical protein
VRRGEEVTITLSVEDLRRLNGSLNLAVSAAERYIRTDESEPVREAWRREIKALNKLHRRLAAEPK